MTDRELLELAAKAAGMAHMKYAGGSGLVRMLDPSRPETTGSIGPCWNPLTSSEDALELMVKLEIHAGISYRRIDACAVGEKDGSVIRATESKTGDIAAALRRAIVRAAAAIQQAKEAQ